MLSLFMPIIVVVPVVLVFINLPRLPQTASAFVWIATIAGIISLRIHFASWYARDKGRAGGWGLLAALGLFGWLVLWSIEDRAFHFDR